MNDIKCYWGGCPARGVVLARMGAVTFCYCRTHKKMALKVIDRLMKVKRGELNANFKFGFLNETKERKKKSSYYRAKMLEQLIINEKKEL